MLYANRDIGKLPINAQKYILKDTTIGLSIKLPFINYSRMNFHQLLLVLVLFLLIVNCNGDDANSNITKIERTSPDREGAITGFKNCPNGTILVRKKCVPIISPPKLD